MTPDQRELTTEKKPVGFVAPLTRLAHHWRCGLGEDSRVERPALIACDIDGTLCDPSGQVTRRTIDVLRRTRDTGTPIVLITSRPPRLLPEIISAIGLTGHAICGNGAVLYDIDANRVVDIQGFLATSALEDIAFRLNKALPGFSLAAERIDFAGQNIGLGNLMMEPTYVHHWPDEGCGIAARAEILSKDTMKLWVRHSTLDSEASVETVRAALKGLAQVAFISGPGIIELSAHGVTKAFGLAAVTERLGIPASRVTAFGDMTNDLEMLTWAGHGVAVANAHEDVLAIADEITGSNAEDGVAQVLERWF